MNGDLISRSALQYMYSKECRGECKVCKHARYTGADGRREYGCALINDAPAEDAALVVHGRWEEYREMPGFLRCSACRDVYIYGDWLATGKWDYCPNCGAKMDKEE